MRRLLIIAAAALALAACQRGAGAEDDKAFGQRVRAYLLAHPEVIKEAADKYQENAEAQAVLKARADLLRHRAAIERDPRDFVANPNGTITVTEFYDYHCPYCVHVAPEILALIRDQKDVRFVFKEMPILGPSSERAARVALAVKRNGGDYLGLHRAFMEAKPLDDAAIDRIAAAHGVRVSTLGAGPERKAADEHLEDTITLFRGLNLSGTPAFVVGDQIVPQANVDEVKAAINKLRGRGVASADAPETGR